MIGTSRLAQKDFENLNTWLEETDGNFFVFPDSTILYGLHQRVSPQPWVFFVPQHSFLESDLAEVDRTIVNSLRANNVTVIVLERASYRGTHELLDEMPELSNWIASQFEKAAEFGMYEVMVLRDGAGSG